MSEFDQARKHMVDSQIRPSDVTDRRLLAALERTPRHLFVPRSRRASAYADTSVATSDQRKAMRPRDLAKLIHAADIQPDELVLDIACGRGYSTAILAHMAETVVGVDNDEDGLSRATDNLNMVGADNAVVVEGDPKQGVPSQGPFNVIFVNGAVETVPQAWFDQLAENGRLAVVIRKGPVGKATIFTRSGAGIGERVVFDSSASVLPGFEAERRFAL
ncbi:protein-L-isoaspartate O-methyltransferase family protein [Maricaulis sp. CAU 1757]